MKNTLLWSAIFALAGAQVHANTSQGANPSPKAHPAAAQTSPTPTSSEQSLPSIEVAPAAIPEMNCEYKISPETKTIDVSIVKSWSKKAAEQAFSFDPNKLDTDLQKLQPCFTEQGWTGFNTALQKSGNIDAIKSQKLTVTSQVEGQIVVKEIKENQWKVNLPLQVVYQNDKEKVTQLLSVDLSVSRKITGDLGITQMIAAPRATVTQQTPASPETSTQNPPASASPTTAPSTPTTPTQPTSPSTQPATPNSDTSAQPTTPDNSTPSTPSSNTQEQPAAPDNSAPSTPNSKTLEQPASPDNAAPATNPSGNEQSTSPSNPSTSSPSAPEQPVSTPDNSNPTSQPATNNP